MPDLKDPTTIAVGTRVSHFGGGPGSHGIGTIIKVRQSPAAAPLDVNKALTFARECDGDVAVASLVAEATMVSAYGAVRCPYLVRWDPNPAFFARTPRLLERFPNQQYEDVYEPECLQLV